MSPEVKEIIHWQRVGLICVELAKRLDISIIQAMNIYYHSKTSERFKDESTELYLYGELYIVDELIQELKECNP